MLRLPVPGSTGDEAEVFRFASSYDAYTLVAPDPADLDRFTLPLRQRPADHPAGVAELRAALFYCARAARYAGDPITELPEVRPLLQRLAGQVRGPLLCLNQRAEGRFGLRPPLWEQPGWEDQTLHDLALLALLDLPRRVDPDHLAWLGLTSKPELAIRDTLGWVLQQTLDSQVVAREWRRSDLAVLSDGQPDLIIEGKALYGFDALHPSTSAKYTAAVSRDIEKASRLSPSAGVTATVLMVTPTSPWSGSDHAAVAYNGSGQNQLTARGGSDSLEVATRSVWTALSALGHVGTIEFEPGTAFGASVSTTIFTVQPAARDRVEPSEARNPGLV